MRFLAFVLVLTLTGCKVFFPPPGWDPDANKVERRYIDGLACKDCRYQPNDYLIGLCRFPLEGCHKYVRQSDMWYCPNCAEILNRCRYCARQFRR